MNRKPGVLTAVQVILFIQSALGVLAVLLGFVALGAIDSAQFEAATGMSSGLYLFLLFIAAASTAFYLFVAFTMGRGGYRTRNLVRVVVGLGVAGALINMASGENAILGLVLMAVIIGLNESSSAKGWYEATENPQPQQSV